MVPPLEPLEADLRGGRWRPGRGDAVALRGLQLLQGPQQVCSLPRNSGLFLLYYHHKEFIQIVFLL